ncbi:MAG: aspartate kinase [Bacteroidales bacterium]
MQVLKFGGSSIGTDERIKRLISLIDFSKNTILVFSAIGGVTNLLVQFIQQAKNSEKEQSLLLIKKIREIHYTLISSLFVSNNFKRIAELKVEDSLKLINGYLRKRINENAEKEILAQGEIISGSIIYLYMLEQEIDAAYVPAIRFMFTDKYNEPDYAKISSKLTKEINKYKGCRIFITNGYICLNHKGKIDNLNRGGSDYTATIIGNAINASVIEIWTDIDGLQNNDPRYVEKTFPIRNLSYDEASELAYFGAKILHPLCIIPAQNKQIPIRLKNTLSPDDRGTLITDYQNNQRITAIAAKDGITVIKIKSGRMMQAYGFLSRVFKVFEDFKTPVDMLTTSEISVAMTIDNEFNVKPILAELKLLGEVEVIRNQSIICVVGSFNNTPTESISEIIYGLKNIQIGMISYGASKRSISFLISSSDKIETLNLLNQLIFDKKLCSIEV